MIDSLNASLAQGILAIYASEMRSQGMDFDTIADTLETYPARMNGIFTVGDLKYLAKTGRLSGSAALIGNILSIKPILRGNKDGYIVQYKKCRGRKAALNTLVSLVCETIIDPKEQIIGIAHVSRLKRRMSHRASIGVSVRRCAWHRGVGTALMEKLIAFARNNSLEQLELEVRSDNERAIRLYEKFGFTKVGTIPAFLKVNGENFSCDYMVLRLADNS